MRDDGNNLTPDVNPETGDFVHKPEMEYSENRAERIKARIAELLESDIPAAVASLEATTMEDEEDFEIEAEVDTLESDDMDRPLSDAEIAALKVTFESDRAKEIFAENNVQFLSVSYGQSHIGSGELVIRVRLHMVHEPKEMSAEFVRLKFSNTCSYCKEAGEADPEVVVEDSVPTSSAGKWKKTKGKEKEKGSEFRDWDYGEVECQKCADRGKPSKIFLYYREYR